MYFAIGDAQTTTNRPHNSSYLKSHVSKNVCTYNILHCSIARLFCTHLIIHTHPNTHTLQFPHTHATSPHINTNTRVDPNFRVILTSPLHARPSTQQPPPRRRPSQTPAERTAKKALLRGAADPVTRRHSARAAAETSAHRQSRTPPHLHTPRYTRLPCRRRQYSAVP